MFHVIFRITKTSHALAFLMLFAIPWLQRAAAAAETCALAQFAGHYVGLENGYVHSQGRTTPAARLYQETWTNDGQVWGTLWLRQGKRFSASPYQGHVAISSDCVATLSRALPTGTWNTTATISPISRRGFTLDTNRGSTISGTLSPQPQANCRSDTLHGLILSSQMGFSLTQGVWRPNAVIQRETHDGKGQLNGLAVTSYAGKLGQVDYTGTLHVNSDCWGSLTEVDNLGTLYHYQVVVSADGSGYYYLQTDPKDLTGAFLAVESQ